MSFPILVIDATTFPDEYIWKYALPHGALPVAPTANIGTITTHWPGPLAGYYDTSGNAFGLTNDGYVFKITPAGGISIFLNPSVGTCNPGGIAIDTSNNLYVTSTVSGGIVKYTSSGAGPTTFATSTYFIDTIGIDANNLYVAYANNTVTAENNGATTRYITNNTGWNYSPGNVFTAYGVNGLAGDPKCVDTVIQSISDTPETMLARQ